MYICQGLTLLDICTRIAYTKDISTPTEGVNLMAKTLIDKSAKENIILPHALKTIHALPSEHRNSYVEARDKWREAYDQSWNVANSYITSHVPQDQIQIVKEVSDSNKWNLSGMPMGKAISELKLEDFVCKEYDKIKSTVGDNSRYNHHSREAFHLDQCVTFNLVSRESDDMRGYDARADFNTYPDRSTFELVEHDYLKENGIMAVDSKEYQDRSWRVREELSTQINSHEAYTKWVVDNFNDKVCIRLNVDCHSQGLAVHDLDDFNAIKQEKILRSRMSMALDNLKEERQGYYDDVKGILSKIRSVEGLMESPLGKMMKPIEGELQGVGTSIALTPQAQFRINKLNNALDGIDDTPQEVPNVIVLHGMSGTA